MAIQLIINREWGLAKNENPNQGSFILEELTDLVEEAVLKEFEAIASRGGVLGAMETGYQRGKIQEESLYYEHKKHDGSYPIVGREHVPQPARRCGPAKIELARSTGGGEARPVEAPARLPGRHAGDASRAAATPAPGGDRRRQRLRGAHGRGARAARSGRSPRPSTRSAADIAATCSCIPGASSCLTEEPTEVLYALGESGRIVGISGFTVRPPRARKEKPKVSAFTSARIDGDHEARARSRRRVSPTSRRTSPRT
jgi:hypothetical protein